MKSFSQIRTELNEAKFKLPSGSKLLKKDIAKVGSSKVDVHFVQNKQNKVDIYLDGLLFGEDPYKDLKSAEKEFKGMKNLMMSMGEEITLEDIRNEINS